MKNNGVKTDPEFWRKIIVENCKICGGAGYSKKNEETGSVELCKCSRMVKLFVKMNDPFHGVNPKYHKWTLQNSSDLSLETKRSISKYITDVVNSDSPFRNVIIKGGRNTGKSSVASIIYKSLMNREYDVSIIQFSELVTLSRLFISNSNAFNERRSFYDLIRQEEFLIIEDVDNRGDLKLQRSERLGYSLLDEIFSYRANHPERATIITMNSDINVSVSTLGTAFFSSIFTSDVENDGILEIELIRKDT